MTDSIADMPAIATPRVAAGILFRNEEGAVLLVKPTYKPFWDLPGGYAEPGESPRSAAVREVAEELDLKISGVTLLSVDWAPNNGEGDKILFIFDGGTLTADQLSKIRHLDGEIGEWRFVPLIDLDQFTIGRLAQRLRSTIPAADTRHTVYLEHGLPADGSALS